MSDPGDKRSLAVACRLLLVRVDLGRLWTDAGPTDEANTLREAAETTLSPRQTLALIAAWTFWDGSEVCRLAASLAAVGADPLDRLRLLLSQPAPLSARSPQGEEGLTNMHSLEGVRVVVTGGSRGLGLALVEALVERKAAVTILARDQTRLDEVKSRLPVSIVAGDVIDRDLAARVLRDVQPEIVVLNAGVRPTPAPIHLQTWEAFSDAWNTDVRAALHWIQEIVRLPLARGSRVLLGSSGAAMGSSPLAGGLSGAKRAMWSMAKYANVSSEQLGLDIKFQTLVPMQIFAETDHGRIAAGAYAKLRGVPVETFIRNAFVNAMTPRDYANHVVSLLTDAAYETGVVYGVKPDAGIVPLDG
jgi:NAD(P)-dependent dehydrogenase (short-subunit alcohol dehydrogenase family)